MDIRERIADTVEVECWCCKYHDNYPMNCYKEPIKTPLCLHRYELANQILAIKVEEDRVCLQCKGEGEIFHRGVIDTLKAWGRCTPCNGTGKLPGRTLKQVLEAQK